MKYTITNECVELKYSFYKIIFPNNQFFKCSFVDNRKITGDLPMQTGLMIYSKGKKYKPWYGVIFKIIIDLFLLAQAPGYIFGLESIEQFLAEAKGMDYNVSDALDEVRLAKQEKITFFGK